MVNLALFCLSFPVTCCRELQESGYDSSGKGLYLGPQKASAAGSRQSLLFGSSTGRGRGHFGPNPMMATKAASPGSTHSHLRPLSQSPLVDDSGDMPGAEPLSAFATSSSKNVPIVGRRHQASVDGQNRVHEPVGADRRVQEDRWDSHKQRPKSFEDSWIPVQPQHGDGHDRSPTSNMSMQNESGAHSWRSGGSWGNQNFQRQRGPNSSSSAGAHRWGSLRKDADDDDWRARKQSGSLPEPRYDWKDRAPIVGHSDQESTSMTSFSATIDVSTSKLLVSTPSNMNSGLEGKGRANDFHDDVPEWAVADVTLNRVTMTAADIEEERQRMHAQWKAARSAKKSENSSAAEDHSGARGPEDGLIGDSEIEGWRREQEEEEARERAKQARKQQEQMEEGKQELTSGQKSNEAGRLPVIENSLPMSSELEESSASSGIAGQAAGQALLSMLQTGARPALPHHMYEPRLADGMPPMGGRDGPTNAQGATTNPQMEKSGSAGASLNSNLQEQFPLSPQAPGPSIMPPNLMAGGGGDPNALPKGFPSVQGLQPELHAQRNMFPPMGAHPHMPPPPNLGHLPEHAPRPQQSHFGGGIPGHLQGEQRLPLPHGMPPHRPGMPLPMHPNPPNFASGKQQQQQQPQQQYFPQGPNMDQGGNVPRQLIPGGMSAAQQQEAQQQLIMLLAQAGVNLPGVTMAGNQMNAAKAPPPGLGGAFPPHLLGNPRMNVPQPGQSVDIKALLGQVASAGPSLRPSSVAPPGNLSNPRQDYASLQGSLGVNPRGPAMHMQNMQARPPNLGNPMHMQQMALQPVGGAPPIGMPSGSTGMNNNFSGRFGNVPQGPMGDNAAMGYNALQQEGLTAQQRFMLHRAMQSAPPRQQQISQQTSGDDISSLIEKLGILNPPPR